MNQEPKFDVALSFAGEDRPYVRTVASTLRENDVLVFFDEYEQVDMWGKNLYEHLHDIYSSKARYCVIFISEAYARKMWTSHERRSAQERALSESSEYILPARFDSTVLPGLPSTVGYVDLKGMPPEQFADLILRKLGKAKSTDLPHEGSSYRIPKQSLPPFDPYEAAEEFISYLTQQLKERSSSLTRADAHLSVHKKGERTCYRVIRGNNVIFSMDLWMGGLAGDSGLSFYAVDGEIRLQSNSINAWADIFQHEDSGEPILRLHDMSLFSRLPGSERPLSFEDFVSLTWDRIVDVVDRLA